MKTVIPEIALDNCGEALGFYESVFGVKASPVNLTDGNPMFEGHEGKIMHAELHLGDGCVFYFNDNFGPKLSGGNVTLVLQPDSMEETERVYERLRDGGAVKFPLQKAFWGAYHAVLTDKFGVGWALNYLP